MIEFDKQLWWDRAWCRFKQSIRRGTKKKTAEAQWFRDALHIEKMVTVISWCASKSIEVKFGKKPGGLYDANLKSITIACRANPEKQLYYLLHECGHHLIGFIEDDERFGKGYPFVNNPEINSTFYHRVACLEEEFEAWNRGWRLARRLGLNLEREPFDKVRVECLRGYIKWTNSRTLMKA